MCKPSVTVRAVLVGAATGSRHSLCRTEDQACGRSKNRKGEKRL